MLQLLPAAEIDAFEFTFAFPIKAVVAVPVHPEQSAAPLVQLPARPVQITPGDGEKEAASGNVKMLLELVCAISVPSARVYTVEGWSTQSICPSPAPAVTLARLIVLETMNAL